MFANARALVCLWALLFMMPLAALDAPSVTLTAQPTAVAVGSPVDIVITYRWPVTSSAVEPDPSAIFATTFVADCPPPESWTTAEENGRRWKFRVLATASGVWELPQPTLRTRSADGANGANSVDSIITADRVIIQVGEQSDPATPSDPRPLWLNADTNQSQHTWIIAAVVAGVLTIIAGALAWWWPRHAHIHIDPPITILQRTLASALSGADGKECGARVSLAIRRYCGEVFYFDGPATTARECSLRMRQHVRDSEHVALAQILDGLDAFRWAADDVGPDDVRPLHERAGTWAEHLHQRLTAEAEAEAAAAAATKGNSNTVRTGRTSSTSNPSAKGST